MLVKEYRREGPQGGMVMSLDRILIDGVDDGRPRKVNRTLRVYMGMMMSRLVMGSGGSTRPGVVADGSTGWHMSNWKREEMDSRHLSETIDALCLLHLRCEHLRRVPKSELPLSPCYHRSLMGQETGPRPMEEEKMESTTKILTCYR